MARRIRKGRRDANRIIRNLGRSLRRVDAKRGRARARGSLRGLSKDNRRAKESRINKERWMERIILLRFKNEAERATGSPRWKPLSPRYALRKRLMGFGNKINVRTGSLRELAILLVAGTFRLGKLPKWNLNEIPLDYAQYVEAARPFLRPPNRAEMSVVRRRALEVAAELN